MYFLDLKVFMKKATDRIELVSDVSRYVPWFLECNQERFPYWWGRPDPRNLQLLRAMRIKY